MGKYFSALINSFVFVIGIVGIFGLAVSPFFLIMTYIPPSPLGAWLMIGWTLILIAIAISPSFVKD